MSLSRSIIDISQPLRPALPVWPGEPAFAYRRLADIGDECPVNTGELSFSTHAGTHADAPLHYAAGASGSSECELQDYLGACMVVDARQSRGRVEVEDIDWNLLSGVPRVLFRTFERFPHDAWDSAFTALAPEVIERLANNGARLIGTDAPSLDPESSKTMDAHSAVLRHDMRILEGLVLDDVSPGPYELIALPLRIEGSDSSPVRAVLLPLA